MLGIPNSFFNQGTYREGSVVPLVGRNIQVSLKNVLALVLIPFFLVQEKGLPVVCTSPNYYTTV
jgi:hypothetical protein